MYMYIGMAKTSMMNTKANQTTAEIALLAFLGTIVFFTFCLKIAVKQLANIIMPKAKIIIFIIFYCSCGVTG